MPPRQSKRNVSFDNSKASYLHYNLCYVLKLYLATNVSGLQNNNTNYNKQGVPYSVIRMNRFKRIFYEPFEMVYPYKIP